MNPAKWDAIAEAFAAGAWVPANGWDAWHEQAVSEAATIRDALPDEVDMLVEYGCGVGRLTPYLGLLFPTVAALDTSSACRFVTSQRTEHCGNVIVMPAAAKLPEPAGRTYAALVWGDLYDSDWLASEVSEHRAMLREKYPLVLEGNAEAHWLYERG